MKEVTCQYESHGYEVEDLDSEKSKNAVFNIILKRCEDGKLFMTMSLDDQFQKSIVMRLDTLLSSFQEVIEEEENERV